MISKIDLHNFKAFRDENIILHPITLFLGPNNSGKSSILSSLRLLSQTIESFDPSVSLLLEGFMGEFGAYKDIVRGNRSNTQVGINLSIKDLVYDADKDNFFWPNLRSRTSGSDSKIKLTYKYRKVRREIILKSMSLHSDNITLIETKYSEDTEKQVINKLVDVIIPDGQRALISRDFRLNSFLPVISFRLSRLEYKRRTLAEEINTPQQKRALRRLNMISRSFRENLSRIEYIGAMRVRPERTYTFTGEKRGRVGSSGENTVNILAMDNLRGGSRTLDISKKAGNWMNKARIASSIKMIPISDRHFEIHVEHPATKEIQNLADTGYGGSQILPVLVGGYNLREGGILVVEEPEIHLHPYAQAELGDFFLELYQNKVQSIIETHSEYLILRLLQHVAKGLIPPNHIGIYFVYSESGEKAIKRLRLDRLGRFKDEWPSGFFPERLAESEKLAKIRFEESLDK